MQQTRWWWSLHHWGMIITQIPPICTMIATHLSWYKSAINEIWAKYNSSREDIRLPNQVVQYTTDYMKCASNNNEGVMPYNLLASLLPIQNTYQKEVASLEYGSKSWFARHCPQYIRIHIDWSIRTFTWCVFSTPGVVFSIELGSLLSRRYLAQCDCTGQHLSSLRAMLTHAHRHTLSLISFHSN